MSAFHDNALIGASGQQGYNISRSVRLRSSASASFSRVLGSSGNLNKWTISFWLKRGFVDSTQCSLVGCQADGNNFFYIRFAGGTQFDSRMRIAGVDYQTTWNPALRDPSAWYHFVYVYDRQNATTADKQILYVNGVRQTTSSAANPATDSTSWNVSGVTHYFGYAPTNTVYFDGYLTEVNFIDGQALTPSSFGETDTITGVWKPKKYAGTYGTNGFYLNFSDNSNNTATTIGKDYSGNGNNWTPNNISVTSGSTYDSMIDVPTPYADGGNGRGNYSVLNPLARRQDVSTLPTFSDGNLKVTFPNASGNATYAMSSIGVESGKWYWEIPVVTRATEFVIGIGNQTVIDGSAGTRGYQATTGTINGFTSNNGPGATYTSGDIIGIALDVGAGTCAFYKNNVLQATGTGLGFTTIHPFIQGNTSDVANANFGQRPFAYTPPSGFVALNTQNLPAPTISNGANYMAASLYTGNGTTVTVTNTTNGTSFLPDFVWVKSRSAAISHGLFDSNRGLSKALYSNATNAEFNYGTGSTSEVYALNSNGFSVGSYGNFNANGTTYVGWQWQAGQGTTSSNTNGSITSTVSVNATAGFSIVTYTGTGANATVGHGLGVAPNMVIVKERNAVRGWPVYHSSLTSATYYVDLQTTAAQASASTIWNSTAPTSTVFSIGTDTGTNQSTGTYVAYCFSAVAGYSAFGSYTGNGSSTDGPFVYLGFRPRFVMVKNITNAADWYMTDTARDTYNVTVNKLTANTNTAESSNSGLGQFDVLSNGFKQRQGAGTGLNNSGDTYIYAAFAENPFKFSLAR